jgi:hypothetical protein
MAAARPNRALFPIPRVLARVDIPTFVRRAVLVVLATGAGTLVCDARNATPNAVTIDALARVWLAARRAGARVELCGGSAELRALIELLGLSETLR